VVPVVEHLAAAVTRAVDTARDANRPACTPLARALAVAASQIMWMWLPWTENWQIRNSSFLQPCTNARCSTLHSSKLRSLGTSPRTRIVTCTGNRGLAAGLIA